MSQDKPMAEMPRYVYPEVIWALKIADVEQSPADEISNPPGGTWRLIPENKEYSHVTISHNFYDFWRPAAGSYYVVRQGEKPVIVSGSAFDAYYSKIASPSQTS